MKFRIRLYLMVILYFLGLGCILALSGYGITRTARLHDTIILGQRLQIESAEVRSLMKDLVFNLFAPKIYGQTRALTYSPRSAVTIRQWQEAVRRYDDTFNQFMSQEFFRNTGDELVTDQYLTALKMNERAMAMLAKTEETLSTLHEEYRSVDNLYNAMQKDASLIPFFHDFQETSYYFTNSFEGFMNYFIDSLNESGRLLTRRINIIVTLSGAGILLIYLLVTAVMIRTIKSQFLRFEYSFRRVARGDFSLRLADDSRDEFGELAHTFNSLIGNLKENVESILQLTRDVGSAITESNSLKNLLELVARAVTQDTGADGALIFRRGSDGEFDCEASSGIALGPSDLGEVEALIRRRIIRTGQQLLVDNGIRKGAFDGIDALVAVPLSAENRIFGILVAVKSEEGQGFTDFGVTRLATLAEFASLTIDNFLKYNELIETREARYQALQSQVQPHFINNVLGSFFGLNRKGDSEGLEQAILALREMLRYVQLTKPWVSLGEEIRFLERYCELQQIRFGDKFSYRFDCDEESRYVRIPRLLLQPLVENALVHGIQPSPEAGRLEVRCRALRLRGETSAEIEILDDGVGFDAAALDETAQIGLSNVRQRLDIADPNHLFRIESSPGEGTKVYIRL